MKKILFGVILLLTMFTSCESSKRIAYFQDITVSDSIAPKVASYITIKPTDMLSIYVSSKNPELAILFNLPRIQQTPGRLDSQISNQDGQLSGYTVDSKGNIDFPVLGQLHIAGMNREEIAAYIKGQLINENLIKDPIVTVDFANLSFSILGEVEHPGLFAIKKDQVTLLEALSMAGDLTIHGLRDKVYVTRVVNGEHVTYPIDLRSESIYRSPGFYIQQNDVIYVTPNRVRANESTVNGNNIKSVSIWISIASFLTTLGVLIFN